MRMGLMAAWLCIGPAMAAPVHYDLPEDTTGFRPGPNLEVAQQNCIACHSTDYISTQPRSFADMHAFWSAEVTKMQKLYGAPIEASDMPKIVDYLTATYGQ